MSRPSSTSYASLSGKRRILLVDTFANKRDLRAKIMRKLGVEVDCAADITEARALWQADSYSLVLVDVRNDSVNVQEFCSEVRSAKPPQAVAFLVGKPIIWQGLQARTRFWWPAKIMDTTRGDKLSLLCTQMPAKLC